MVSIDVSYVYTETTGFYSRVCSVQKGEWATLNQNIEKSTREAIREGLVYLGYSKYSLRISEIAVYKHGIFVKCTYKSEAPPILSETEIRYLFTDYVSSYVGGNWLVSDINFGLIIQN